jgi:BON domain
MRTMVGAAIGAAGMYLLDPQLGRTRRAKLGQQIGSLNRRVARDAGRKGEYVRGQAEGLRHVVRSDAPPAPENDEMLTAKVESEVLSRANYPKGDINVNSVDGIVELRGVCESQEQIDQLEQEVRKVTGVFSVRNYLRPRTDSVGS